MARHAHSMSKYLDFRPVPFRNRREPAGAHPVGLRGRGAQRGVRVCQGCRRAIAGSKVCDCASVVDMDLVGR